MSGLSAPAGAGTAVPSCAEVEQDCARSGWVFKQSAHVKKWNRRYFVLWPKQAHPKKGRLLFYYTTPQDKKPRGLIPLVPKNYTASVDRLSELERKGMALESALQINLCETDAYENVLATYILADTSDTDIQGWAADVGGAQAPRSAGMSMAGGMAGGMGATMVVGNTIDPAPLFKAAQAGDIRTLAQLALKMVESANGKIAELAAQVETLQQENADLERDNALLAGGDEKVEAGVDED